ncbi:MAG: SAM-dependent DNA methyltransferase, partial [Thermoguttaceae bacterium]|nr:SAM-dependent DNA methyltransferase [Thermoguttaceae bacterium]
MERKATQRRRSSSFDAVWKRRFGANSPCAQRALAELIDAFSTRTAKTAKRFRLWESVWNSTSDVLRRRDLGPAFQRAFAPLFAARPDLRSRPGQTLNVEERERFSAFCFVMQTYVVESILAVLERYYELSPDELRALFGDSPFNWGESVRETLNVGDDDLDALQLEDYARENDPFAETYAKFFSFELRKTLGEFYTPAPLANYLRKRAFELSRAKYPTILDPTCGAGVFLTSSLRAFLDAGLDPSDALGKLAGFDVSPLAVVTARANLLLAATSRAKGDRRKDLLRTIAAERRQAAPSEPTACVCFFDALAEEPPDSAYSDLFGLDVQKWIDSPGRSRRFDVLLGNPPWIAWDKTSDDYREKTKRFWKKYGLFDLSGKDARYGGSKKELASLIVYATIDKRLNDGGVFAFVLPKSLFQTNKAGSGFRRFGEQTQTPFAALELDDFSELDLFSNVASKATGFVGRKGSPTRYPVALRRWNARKKDASEPFEADVVEGRATPASATPGAPLIFETRERESSCARDDLTRRQDELVRALFQREVGRSSRYRAKLGANAAGASGVFWLESSDSLDSPLTRVRNLFDSGKRKVERVEAELETALLFPLIRWRDVDEYRIKAPKTLMLVPQDPETRKGIAPETMEALYPKTLDYLRRFEPTLRDRAAYRRYQNKAPFWSLYNVGTETFAPIKVVWRRMDSTMRAAALIGELQNKPFVPQETLSFVAVKSPAEADYLCAALNSNPARKIFESTGATSGKGFGS